MKIFLTGGAGSSGSAAGCQVTVQDFLVFGPSSCLV